MTNNHSRQRETEREIMQSIPLDKIRDIVGRSTFSVDEKHILLSRIYCKIEQYGIALEEITKTPMDNQHYCFQAGVCSYKLGLYDDALKQFEMCVQLNPLKAEAYNNIACCLKHLGRGDALSYFEKAHEIRPEYNDPVTNIENIEKEEVCFTERELRKTLINYKNTKV